MGYEKKLPERYFETFTVAAGVAASGSTNVGITEANEEKYGYFNTVCVVNKSGEVIGLIPDGVTAKMIVIPNGSVQIWNDLHFRQLTLKNLDTVNATDAAIYVSVQKEIGTREFLLGLYELDKMLKGD